MLSKHARQGPSAPEATTAPAPNLPPVANHNPPDSQPAQLDQLYGKWHRQQHRIQKEEIERLRKRMLFRIKGDSHGGPSVSGLPKLPIAALAARKSDESRWDPRFRRVNIMYDPRVRRGNTHSMNKSDMATFAAADLVELHSYRRERRRKRALEKIELDKTLRNLQPVKGRAHLSIQTAVPFEELLASSASKKSISAEASSGTQTEALYDRAPSPLFIPAKTGVDVGTTMGEGDLFDFDREVEPLLEVLAGKVLEEALFEVVQEEEIRIICATQAEYETRKAIELSELKRLEEAEKRREEERLRRLAELESEVCADPDPLPPVPQLAQPPTTEELIAPGVTWRKAEDNETKEVVSNFTAWVEARMMAELGELRVVKAVLHDIVGTAASQRLGGPRGSHEPKEPDQNPESLLQSTQGGVSASLEQAPLELQVPAAPEPPDYDSAHVAPSIPSPLATPESHGQSEAGPAQEAAGTPTGVPTSEVTPQGES